MCKKHTGMLKIGQVKGGCYILTGQMKRTGGFHGG